MDFDTAIARFATAIDASTKEHAKTFSNLDWSDDGTGFFKPVSVKKNQKRAKVITHNGQTSVYCFVDIATGDILKAAGWSAPAKGARGNIFDPATYEGAELYSTGWMYRRR